MSVFTIINNELLFRVQLKKISLNIIIFFSNIYNGYFLITVPSKYSFTISLTSNKQKRQIKIYFKKPFFYNV